MLKNVKSCKVMKKIFSNIEHTTKLKLIIYNKNIQQKLNIKITDFMRFSGRYKAIDEDGKIKEYDGRTHYLIFEGEYLNKKRNGLGKEYNEYVLKNI